MFTYKTDHIEIHGEYYLLNQFDKSKVCYDDLTEYCENYKIQGIASVETINDFSGANIEEYQDIFNMVKDGYPESLVIIPLHNLMYYGGREYIERLCTDIEDPNDLDLGFFNPFPFCKYTRYIWYNPEGDESVYDSLIPSAIKNRFIRTINKARSRYNLIKDFLGHPDFKNADISNASIEELKEYAEYLQHHMKEYI